MNKIYSILFDIFAAGLFLLSMWLISRSDAKWVGLILFGIAMFLLCKSDSLWATKSEPKKKGKKQL